MKHHDQGADADPVATVGENEQEDGGQMVNHLFFKVLVKHMQSLDSVNYNDVCVATEEFKFLLFLLVTY